MHFYMFNPSDFNNSARHLSLVERAIYRDLIDMYYHNEQAIDTSDMDALARRLLCDCDEYRAALNYVLDEFFIKRGKRHHHHRIDKEIKAYQYKNKKQSGHTDVTQGHIGVTQGVTSSHTQVTSDVTQGHTDVTNNSVTMTDAERKRKSRQDKRDMINDLTNIGVSIDKNIKIAALREIHAKHIDTIKSSVTSDVTHNSNDDVTQPVTSGHTDVTQGHDKNAAITKNHEPETNNQQPVSESAHTNTGEAVVDNFNHGSVDNSTDNNQSSANQPATKADQIRDQRADDIENWEAPTIDQMRGELFKAGKMMQLTEDQYDLHVSDFKSHYAEQALLGKPLATESNRRSKLRKWLAGEIDKQAANQARQDKAKGRFNIDNEDWSASNSTSPRHSQVDSDLPPVFHPSHSQPVQAKLDPSKCCIFNGLCKEPLPNMSIAETYEHIKQQKMPGESADETYDRVLNQLQEAV